MKTIKINCDDFWDDRTAHKTGRPKFVILIHFWNEILFRRLELVTKKFLLRRTCRALKKTFKHNL